MIETPNPDLVAYGLTEATEGQLINWCINRAITTTSCCPDQSSYLPHYTEDKQSKDLPTA